MEVAFTPQFGRQFKKLDRHLKEDALDKIDLFRIPENHLSLKVHMLKGKLQGKYAFSVNSKTRIIFVYITKNEALLLAIGSHDIYN